MKSTCIIVRSSTKDPPLHVRRHKRRPSWVPPKPELIREQEYIDYLKVERRALKIITLRNLLLRQRDDDFTLPVARFDLLACRKGFDQYQAGKIALRFPECFEIYEHPVQRVLYCRVAQQTLDQIEAEKQALHAQLPDAITRLRKLLMMSCTGRLRLIHIRIIRKALGLPDDFEYSVILTNPKYFRLVNAEGIRSKYIEIVERDPSLAICAVEKERERQYRERGLYAEKTRFSFIMKFAQGFKFGKYNMVGLASWQRMPYWSPYEDVSGYDLRSIEAQKRMEKRAVATVHELLSLMVEKKMKLHWIVQFRWELNLPNRLKDFLLHHQGMFYVTAGFRSSIHTIYLREAYSKGMLIKPNDLYLARRRLAELVWLRCTKPKEGNRYKRMGRCHEMGSISKDVGNDDDYGGEKGYLWEDREGDLDFDFSDKDSDF